MPNSDGRKHRSAVAAVLCFLAIGLALATAAGLGHLHGQQAERRHTAAHQHAESGKADARRACVGVEAAAVFECVYEQVERSQESARAEQDLDAQQAMALWAAAMVAVSLLTAGIALTALYYVRETLLETQEMTAEARRTTTAAEKTVAVSEDTAKRQLRAYLNVASVHIEGVGEDDDYKITVTAEIKNSGQTPGKLTHYHTTAYWYTESEALKDVLKIGVDTSVIVPTATEMTLPLTLPLTFENMVVSDVAGALIVFIKLTYQDIFKRSRTSKAAFITGANFQEAYPDKYRFQVYAKDHDAT